MPSQNIGRDTEIENSYTPGVPNDNRICKQILESDPAARVAAFIERGRSNGLRGDWEDKKTFSVKR